MLINSTRVDALYPHDGKKLAECHEALQIKARDNARTPMQWSSAANAGFTNPGVKPWMRVNDDYETLNADTQTVPQDPEDGLSVWQFWQRGLASRKEHKDVFVYGSFQLIDPEHEKVFAYLRTGAQAGTWVVALNFSGDEVEWTVPGDVKVQGWMAGTYMKGKPDKSRSGMLVLKPWEGLLGKCK